MSEFTQYASVILDQAVGKTLDYGVPKEFADLVKRGVRVEVPLRGRSCGGYVFKLKEQAEFKVKPIRRVLSETELITNDLLHQAVGLGMLSVVQEMLKRGADFCGQTEFGYTVLHHVAGREETELLSFS